MAPDSYFDYYAQCSHQAQMLQDSVRTGVYQNALLAHSEEHFRDKIVMDVGAGNGILSLFAIQAGARKVFAVEASNMVQHLETLVRASKGTLPTPSSEEEDDMQWYLEGQGFDAKAHARLRTNPWIGDKLVPVHSKVEDVTVEKLMGEEKVDTIVSECLGVLLVHERMCESFLDARDRFLKPGGALFPSSGTICFSPISDSPIWDEVALKARFWQQRHFYGVDLHPFFASAWKEAFSSPVVGCFNPNTVLATPVEHLVDFRTVTMEGLRRFEVPLDWEVRCTGVVHGIGGWFDLDFGQEGKEDEDSDATEDAAPSSASKDEAMDEEPYAGLSVNAPAFEPSSSSNGASATLDAQTAALLSAAAASTSTSAAPPPPPTSSTYMTTSPYATPTHWQQARLLFPEPLAVNRGQRLVGSLRFAVNDNRSYDIDGEVRLVEEEESADASAEGEGKGDKAKARATTRRFRWHLDRQYYSFTTSNAGQPANGAVTAGPGTTTTLGA